MIETSLVPPRKSSVIFGKCPENVRKRSPGLRNNFGKSSEIFGKWSEIFGKSSSLVLLYNKQNFTSPLVDMNFFFSCSTRYLTRSLRSLVRYRVEHSEIKFISMRDHAISSMSLTPFPFFRTYPSGSYSYNGLLMFNTLSSFVYRFCSTRINFQNVVFFSFTNLF